MGPHAQQGPCQQPPNICAAALGGVGAALSEQKSFEMKNTKEALFGATGKDAKRLIKQLAVDCEDISLGNPAYPDECIDMICEILATDAFFTKPGIDYFLFRTLAEIYKFSEQQKLRILETITDNYERYSDLDMCWGLGDWIARTYDGGVALNVFRSLFNKATDNGREGIVLGLDVLVRLSKRDPQLIKQVHEIIQS